jgi:hypothetical protein
VSEVAIGLCSAQALVHSLPRLHRPVPPICPACSTRASTVRPCLAPPTSTPPTTSRTTWRMRWVELAVAVLRAGGTDTHKRTPVPAVLCCAVLQTCHPAHPGPFCQPVAAHVPALPRPNATSQHSHPHIHTPTYCHMKQTPALCHLTVQAAWLYRATGEAAYLTAARGYLKRWQVGVAGSLPRARSAVARKRVELAHTARLAPSPPFPLHP